MEHQTTQRLGLAVGIGLIVIYSVIMMATGGSAPAAWLLLLGGIATLVVTGVRAKREG